jgi:hypothetical protein
LELAQLEEKRLDIITRIRTAARSGVPDMSRLTAGLGLLHQANLDIAHIEEILGHSDAVSIHRKSAVHH